MIWIEIIILIGLVILLVAMLRDKKKHPEDYKVPERRKKRRSAGFRDDNMSNYDYMISRMTGKRNKDKF